MARTKPTTSATTPPAGHSNPCAPPQPQTATFRIAATQHPKTYVQEAMYFLEETEVKDAAANYEREAPKAQLVRTEAIIADYFY